MNNFNYHISTDVQSDNQTVTPAETIQQPIVTLEYLLNQNKMKEIALSKATHLIQLYKIQLQVKQQDYLKEIQNLTQTQKLNYESHIKQLQDKIFNLEKQLKTYEHKIKDLEKRSSQNFDIQKLNQSGCRMPQISRKNSGKDLINNKKGRYSHTKNLTGSQQNPLKRSLTNFFCLEAGKEQDLYRIQKSFLIRYIMQSEQKDQKMINFLQNDVNTDPELMAQLKSSIKSNERLMDQFLKQMKQPVTELQTKLKEHRQIIKIQELIIQELNGQLNEYQELFSGMNGSLEQIYSKQNDPSTLDQIRFNIVTASNSYSKPDNMFQQFRQVIDSTQSSTVNKLRQHKSFIKQKVTSMEAENKELKRILDDMIKLIKNNKKLHMASFGTIKAAKTTQEIQTVKQKSKSQMISRK